MFIRQFTHSLAASLDSHCLDPQSYLSLARESQISCSYKSGKFHKTLIYLQNSFPMKQWHLEHMQKTILKYVTGLSPDASSFEKRNHKKYGSLMSVCRQIEYDMKHGVTREEIESAFFHLQSDSSFKSLRKNEDSMTRLVEMQAHFGQPIVVSRWK